MEIREKIRELDDQISKINDEIHNLRTELLSAKKSANKKVSIGERIKFLELHVKYIRDIKNALVEIETIRNDATKTSQEKKAAIKIKKAEIKKSSFEVRKIKGKGSIGDIISNSFFQIDKRIINFVYRNDWIYNRAVSKVDSRHGGKNLFKYFGIRALIVAGVLGGNFGLFAKLIPFPPIYFGIVGLSAVGSGITLYRTIKTLYYMCNNSKPVVIREREIAASNWWNNLKNSIYKFRMSRKLADFEKIRFTLNGKVKSYKKKKNKSSGKNKHLSISDYVRKFCENIDILVSLNRIDIDQYSLCKKIYDEINKYYSNAGLNAIPKEKVDIFMAYERKVGVVLQFICELKKIDKNKLKGSKDLYIRCKKLYIILSDKNVYGENVFEVVPKDLMNLYDALCNAFENNVALNDCLRRMCLFELKADEGSIRDCEMLLAEVERLLGSERIINSDLSERFQKLKNDLVVKKNVLNFVSFVRRINLRLISSEDARLIMAWLPFYQDRSFLMELNAFSDGAAIINKFQLAVDKAGVYIAKTELMKLNVDDCIRNGNFDEIKRVVELIEAMITKSTTVRGVVNPVDHFDDSLKNKLNYARYVVANPDRFRVVGLKVELVVNGDNSIVARYNNHLGVLVELPIDRNDIPEGSDIREEIKKIISSTELGIVDASKIEFVNIRYVKGARAHR